MSLKAIYERFLASPNPLSLAENASLNYISTLQTFAQPGPVIRHLERQFKNEVHKKAEKILAAVEGHDSLVVDLETTLEFVAGGGAYLPGLDNFITDRTVTFPSIHIVNFDNDHKILRIRIHWDQGSLLRQVDVIGSRGKNWPITDGKDQSRLIASTTKTGARSDAPQARGREANDQPSTHRNISPSKKRIQDPHTSLNLFKEQGANDEGRTPQQAAIAPRASAKPAARDYGELFAAGNEEFEDGKDGTPSPKKPIPQTVVAPKGGGASKYQPSRLFSEETPQDGPAKYKSHPLKYNHFDLGEAPEEKPFQRADPKNSQAVPLRAKTNKHLSQWGFEDFVTPEKSRNQVRGQDVRHFGWSDDEGEKDESPGKHPRVAKARPDSKPHFELKDDGTPNPNQQRAAGRPKGNASNAGQGLYKNNIYDEESDAGKDEGEKEPLAAVTNNAGRSKDFGKHWTNADDSPAANDQINNENRPLADDRKKAVKMMDAHWESYDHSPEPTQKGLPSKPGRRAMDSQWGFDDEKKAQTTNNKKSGKGFWDF